MFSESVVLCVRVFARVFLIASVLRSQYDEAFKMMQGVRERRHALSRRARDAVRRALSSLVLPSRSRDLRLGQSFHLALMFSKDAVEDGAHDGRVSTRGGARSATLRGSSVGVLVFFRREGVRTHRTAAT